MGRALAITTKWLCVLSPLLAWMPEPAAAQGCEWARGFQSPGASDPLRALTVFDDGTGPALYAGGEFTTAGGVAVNNIAKWEGRQWSALGGGTNMPVYALTVFDDGAGPALYAGGIFSGAGDVAATKIAKWNGTQWSALGTGIHGPYVNALAVFDDG